MKVSIRYLIVSFVILSTPICQDFVQITVSVTVPIKTPQVLMVGNVPVLGNWNHSSALQLTMIDSITFSGSFSALRNTSIEYKITQGSWESEALAENSNIPVNTKLIVQGETTINHTVASWKNGEPVPGAGITGEVRYHRDFYSPQLDNRRDIIVWLPPSYSTADTNQYPVLYMHDGQNIIDPLTSFAGQDWQIDETATRLIKSGAIEEIIIVGINNTSDRTPEYSPVLAGQQYSAFIINTLKPFIDTEYRTKPEPEYTATMGSSMGGIISFHLAWDFPHVFGMAGCLSPAFLIDDLEIVDRVASYTDEIKPILLYIDNGTVGLEQKLQPAIDELIPILAQAGFEAGTSLIYSIAEDAEHNEAAWAKRAAVPLRFFYGKDN